MLSFSSAASAVTTAVAGASPASVAIGATALGPGALVTCTTAPNASQLYSGGGDDGNE